LPGSSSLPTRTGRPKDPAKRAAIVQTAIQLFAIRPFDSVTMEAVAIEAGVSKQTVYSHFSDKDTLFEATVTAISDQMVIGLSEPEMAGQSLQSRLSRMGVAFLSVILGLNVANMTHTLAAALRGNKELAARFYNAGPGRTTAALADIISSAASLGELAVDSPEQAAEDLLSLWAGNLPAEVAFGIIENVSAEEIQRRTQHGIKVFLHAYGNVHKS
jgi:TetR/AcrR family transcriptional repressor of mexJK operon